MGRDVKEMGRRITTLCVSMALVVTGVNMNAFKIHADGTETMPWLLSEGRPAYASSVNGGDIASYATDGKLNTQWGAEADKNNQWLDVDLGKSAEISKIEIDWQNNASYGVVYDVLVSDDEVEWKKIYSETEGTGGEITNVYARDGESVDYSYYKEVLNDLSGSGRYVRIQIQYSKSQYDSAEKKGWGASIRELKVYGTGGVNKPRSDAQNIAMGKEVTVSSYEEPWWASQPLSGSNSVDEDYDTYWLSAASNEEWLQVDLGETYTLGRVLIQWQVEYARIYDLQLSEDGENWTTIYRQLHGNGEDEEINLYGKARYVRMKGISMGRGSGYSIREMKIYEYEEGDIKENQEIPALPEGQTVSLGKGSYAVDDVNMAQPREPKYITENIKAPIPSNDWWTSVIYTRLSDTMPALPFVYKYTENGLGMYYADTTYTRTNDGGMGADSKYLDLTVGTSDIHDTPSARLDSFGDWSANIVFSDDDTKKLETTIIKGSPFVYNKFSEPSKAEITISDGVKIFDENNNEILTEDGEQIIADHIGVEVHNISEAPGDGDKNQYHFYGIYVPENTIFTKVGSKLKVKLGNDEGYMSIGVLESEEGLGDLYPYAYAFVTDTNVSYDFEDDTSMMKTTYTVATDVKREGFRDETLMCMMPHQWKYSNETITDKIYQSIRGTLKVVAGKKFSYSLKFQGVIPSFTEPIESESYDREAMIGYLQEFANSTARDYWVADPYWQGKKTHPIAMGIFIAEQLGEYEIRDELISILRKILVNWYTYDGEEEYPYYLYYHTSWGAISGDGGDHGMAINLSDHHFLWAYFIFPSAVLASYDKQFVEDYGDMVELLIRDCMNPDKEDELLPFMRNFDPYEGHSWAGGYGDNNSGNNQESASEATFAWSGLYLWGLVTGNETYKEAGIWGYTSEINAIEQYWFDYDGDTWDDDYGAGCVGMVWGLGYTNGTYFSGNPSCIYGIHMLPVTPALTYMGYQPEQAARIYAAYEQSQEEYQKKVAAEENSDPEGWFHILWPYLSLSDPERAAEKWKEEIASHTNENGVYAGGNLPNDEMFNSYWFLQNMCAKGLMATDVWSDNYTSYEVFQKDGEYKATVWNPFDNKITVTFRNEQGKIGQTTVAAHATVTVDPFAITDCSDITIPEVESKDKVLQVPGVIEAEDYYTNFSCMKDTDHIEGDYIGWIDDGDSLIFDTDVLEEGEYIVAYRFISTSDEKIGKIKLESDLSEGVLSEVVLNDTKSWNTVTDKVYLKAGVQKLKTYFATGGFNLNWIKIYKEGTKPPVAESDDLTKADLSGYPQISLENADISASSVVGWNTEDKIADGDYSTRWESESLDPQSITIELDAIKEIGGIKIYWEAAAAKNYMIEVSEDGTNWNTAFTRKNGTGGAGYGDENRDSGLEAVSFEGVYDAKYIKITGIERLTGYGYSIYEVKLYGRGPDQSKEGEFETTEPVTENTTTGNEIIISDGVELNGYQVSAAVKGMRTIYSVEPIIDGKEVVSRGLVYALEGYAEEKDMYYDSKSAYVKAFHAKVGKIDKNVSSSETAESYAMTVKFGAFTEKEYNSVWMVRVFAQLSDGTYVYSDVETYSAYTIADYLYTSQQMPSLQGHNYLFDEILSIVNKNYVRIEYDVKNTIVVF